MEVLARLDEEHGGLGKLADLPPVVVAEMKELGLYDLFAAHEKNAPAQSSYRGKPYYFCSEECKETFDVNPQKYVKQPATTR